MLRVEALETAYGDSQILFGIDLHAEQGEVLALLGRNGMGKTTTVNSIFGLVKPRRGRVWFDGHDLTGMPPYAIAQRGLGLVPEGRQIFPTLSVEENLFATAAARFGPARWTLAGIYELFPSLAERRQNLGSELSGGEQQMLAIGRALMTNPKLLVLDEATEGLAPLIRAEIWSCLLRLKHEGQAIIVIDKNIGALVKLADRHVVLEKGRVVWTGASHALAADPSVTSRYLHLGAPRSSTGVAPMQPLSIAPMSPGITPAGTGIDAISWSILGQTYVPKQVSQSSMSWHATLPPGTFVPPHIHPLQDEFIYLLEGRIDLALGDKELIANAGDLIRLPMGLPHGIFNKSDRVVKCLFWVSPTRRLYDLFWAIHNLPEQTPAEVVALAAKHEVDFLPPPGASK